MLDSTDGKRYSLEEYAHSKQVCKDLPKLISIYDKLIPVLAEYQCYTGAAQVLELVVDSKRLLEVQLNYYKRVNAKKGLIDNE